MHTDATAKGSPEDREMAIDLTDDDDEPARAGKRRRKETEASKRPLAKKACTDEPTDLLSRVAGTSGVVFANIICHLPMRTIAALSLVSKAIREAACSEEVLSLCAPMLAGASIFGTEFRFPLGTVRGIVQRDLGLAPQALYSSCMFALRRDVFRMIDACTSMQVALDCPEDETDSSGDDEKEREDGDKEKEQENDDHANRDRHSRGEEEERGQGKEGDDNVGTRPDPGTPPNSRKALEKRIIRFARAVATVRATILRAVVCGFLYCNGPLVTDVCAIVKDLILATACSAGFRAVASDNGVTTVFNIEGWRQYYIRFVDTGDEVEEAAYAHAIRTMRRLSNIDAVPDDSPSSAEENDMCQCMISRWSSDNDYTNGDPSVIRHKETTPLWGLSTCAASMMLDQVCAHGRNSCCRRLAKHGRMARIASDCAWLSSDTLSGVIALCGHLGGSALEVALGIVKGERRLRAMAWHDMTEEERRLLPPQHKNDPVSDEWYAIEASRAAIDSIEAATAKDATTTIFGGVSKVIRRLYDVGRNNLCDNWTRAIGTRMDHRFWTRVLVDLASEGDDGKGSKRFHIMDRYLSRLNKNQLYEWIDPVVIESIAHTAKAWHALDEPTRQRIESQEDLVSFGDVVCDLVVMACNKCFDYPDSMAAMVRCMTTDFEGNGFAWTTSGAGGTGRIGGT
jgi:hypothetical protein